jgi:hypothetical protein
MRIRKESNIFNSVNQKILKANKGEKEQIIELTRKRNNKITGINKYFPKVTLNVNGLNIPNKRHKQANWI